MPRCGSLLLRYEDAGPVLDAAYPSGCRLQLYLMIASSLTRYAAHQALVGLVCSIGYLPKWSDAALPPLAMLAFDRTGAVRSVRDQASVAASLTTCDL